MNISGPLGAGLFFYECIRILFLVVFLLIQPREASVYGIYSVYLSSNALFPMMVLFVWLRPEEYRNYLTLYTAGKIIVIVSFYAWEIFSFLTGNSALFDQGGGYRLFSEAENAARGMILLWGSIILGLTDILSLLGGWTLKNKFRMALATEGGGFYADYSGGEWKGRGR